MDQKTAINYLEHAVKSGRMANGYLIEGLLRESAEPLAERFLMTLFCTDEKKPCGNCRNCRFVINRTHPDVQWVEPEKKSRKIGADRMRVVLEQMALTSFCGGWKVCVIVGADRLGEETSNIMLKSLEEPPGKGFFLLLTDMPNMLLPTIISRCQRVRLSFSETLGNDDIVKRVIEIFKQPFYSRLESSYGRAYRLKQVFEEMLDEITFEEKEKTKKSGNTAEIDKDELEARIRARYIEERAKVIKYILLWYRDILLAKCGVESTFWFCKAGEKEILEKSAKIPLRQAFMNIKGIDTIMTQLQYNMPEDMVLANVFAYMS